MGTKKVIVRHTEASHVEAERSGAKLGDFRLVYIDIPPKTKDLTELGKKLLKKAEDKRKRRKDRRRLNIV